MHSNCTYESKQEGWSYISEGSLYSVQKNNPVFSKHTRIPSILQAVEVWHLQTLHHKPLIALWIMTPLVIPAGNSGSHQESIRGLLLSPLVI